LGSRFGGDKQLVGFGPDGHTLLELNAHDAWVAGCARLDVVTRQELAGVLKRRLDSAAAQMPVHVLTQSPTLRPGTTIPEGRLRPWGTAHALLAVSDPGPVVVANADDLYGRVAVAALVRGLQDVGADPAAPVAVLAGYPVEDTLSPHGGVSRAIVRSDPQGRVHHLEEVIDVARQPDGSIRGLGNEGTIRFAGGDRVSMNLWGLSGRWWPLLHAQLDRFAHDHGGSTEAEFRLPDAVLAAASTGAAQLLMVPVDGPWAGVTFPKDREAVEAAVSQAAASGHYPSTLFQSR